jgi:hypothetical protein
VKQAKTRPANPKHPINGIVRQIIDNLYLIRGCVHVEFHAAITNQQTANGRFAMAQIASAGGFVGQLGCGYFPDIVAISHDADDAADKLAFLLEKSYHLLCLQVFAGLCLLPATKARN